MAACQRPWSVGAPPTRLLAACPAPLAPVRQARQGTGLTRSWVRAACRRARATSGEPSGSGGGDPSGGDPSGNGGSSSGSSSSGGSSGGPPPGASPAAVADWAAVSFRDAASGGQLAKACLLLALEEEAAAAAAYADAEGLGGADSAADAAALQRSVGLPSTWSLRRLQALADEAALAFYALLHEAGVAGAVLSPTARAAPDSTLLLLHQDLVRGYPTQLLTAVNHVLFERHGYRRMHRHGDPLECAAAGCGAAAWLVLPTCRWCSLCPAHSRCRPCSHPAARG